MAAKINWHRYGKNYVTVTLCIGRHHTHRSNSVHSQPIFKFFSLSDSLVNSQQRLKIPPHLTCVATLPCKTLMSENERLSQTNAVVNDKLLGTVVTHLRSGGIFNNQIEKRLLLSLPVKFFKSVNIWHSYGQKGGLCRAFSSKISIQCGVQALHKVHETTTFLLVKCTQ